MHRLAVILILVLLAVPVRADQEISQDEIVQLFVEDSVRSWRMIEICYWRSNGLWINQVERNMYAGAMSLIWDYVLKHYPDADPALITKWALAMPNQPLNRAMRLQLPENGFCNYSRMRISLTVFYFEGDKRFNAASQYLLRNVAPDRTWVGYPLFNAAADLGYLIAPPTTRSPATQW